MPRTTARRGARRRRRPVLASIGVPRSEAATTAWLAALPCAVLVLAAVVLLGPLLRHVMYPAELTLQPLPGDTEPFTPEPLEGTRYLLALLAPVLLSLVVVVARRRGMRTPRHAVLAVALTQAIGVAVVAVSIVEQHQPKWFGEYFFPRWLVVAVVVAGAIVLAARSASFARTAARRLADTRGRRAALLAAAALLTILWCLPAIDSETTIAWAVNFHDAAFHLDETFAVLNGLTPHYDFTAQYASLLPYFIGPVLLTFGKTLLVFTITLSALTALALLGIYDVLRRAAGSTIAGFLLFVPFLAMSLYNIGTPVSRFTPGTYFPMFPLRYGGPFLLAWLVARRLDAGERTRWPTWGLFGVAGLVVLNNLEFGMAALVATLAALLWTMEERTPRSIARVLGQAALGFGAAVVLYSLFTLVRAGGLPRFDRTLQFARLYGVSGYSTTPLPGVLGLPFVILLTYVAAIVTATVRAVDRHPNRVLTGMLAWSGVFGLGAATYYVARSRPSLLPASFAIWALALMLLAIVAWSSMRESPRRLPGLAMLGVLFGVGICVAAVGQIPWPGAQIDRLQRAPANARVEADRSPLTAPVTPSRDREVRRFVTSLADGPDRFVAKAGAPVALYVSSGHRIADAYDVVDVVPYTGIESIHTEEQLEETLDALRAAGGNTVLVAPERMQLMAEVLLRRDFAIVTRSGLRRSWPGGSVTWPGIAVVGGLTKWVDTQYLHPAALA